jgi:hypothetical protein
LTDVSREIEFARVQEAELREATGTIWRFSFFSIWWIFHFLFLFSNGCLIYLLCGSYLFNRIEISNAKSIASAICLQKKIP